MSYSSENAEAAQDVNYDPLRTHSSGQVSSEEGDGWEEVGDREKEDDEKQRGQHEETIPQEYFSEGSKVFEDGDFDYVVRCLRRSLEIRVEYHGKLSPECRDTYYRYGWDLLCKAQAWSASNEDPMEGTTSEYDSEDIDYSFIACFKALAILAHLVEPYYHHIMNLKIQTCFAIGFPKSGDAKAISSWKTRIQNLKTANEALLPDKGDDGSATEVGLEESGLEESSLAKDIQVVHNILLSALEKLEVPEQRE